jgi:hypothetical protein
VPPLLLACGLSSCIHGTSIQADPVAPGALAAEKAADPAFCRLFREADRGVALPEAARAVEASSTWSYEYAGQYARYDFDIDNDGKSDAVVGLHAYTHYRDGDVYFVFDQGTVVPVAAMPGNRPRDEGSERAFERAATRIVPHAWVGAQRALVDADEDDASLVARNAGQQLAFRVRYLHLSPFRLDGTTYFISSSEEPALSRWVGVFRPEPGNRISQVCLFHLPASR